MTAVPASLCCVVLLFSCAFAEEKIITAEPEETVILPCHAKNNSDPEAAVEWSRADLYPEYVLLYRDVHPDLVKQHPSFKDRVDLQDKEMKDGDVSLILKNVMINDTGTYECRIKEKGTSRGVIPSEPISIVYLRVVVPPGRVGRNNDGEDEDDGSAGLRVGLPVSALLVVVVAAIVALLIYRKHKEQQSKTSGMNSKSPAAALESSVL